MTNPVSIFVDGDHAPVPVSSHVHIQAAANCAGVKYSLSVLFIELNAENDLFACAGIGFDVHFLEYSFSPDCCHGKSLFGENRREGREKKGQKTEPNGSVILYCVEYFFGFFPILWRKESAVVNYLLTIDIPDTAIYFQAVPITILVKSPGFLQGKDQVFESVLIKRSSPDLFLLQSRANGFLFSEQFLDLAFGHH